MIDTGGVLVEDRTVSGYVARGREVKGVCHVHDCEDTAKPLHSRQARVLTLEQGLEWLRLDRSSQGAVGTQPRWAGS